MECTAVQCVSRINHKSRHRLGAGLSGLGVLTHAGHGWSPLRYIFKMARGAVKF